MAIEFVCSHCSKPYRVKDELAGRTAKCGKCGERMQIPQPGKVVTKSPAAAQPAAASKTAAAAKGTAAGKTTAAPRSAATAIASGAQKTGVSRPAAAGTANGQRPKQPPPQPDQARPAATHDTVANASASSDTGSWLDDDLLAAPAQHPSRPSEIACPKCGKRQPPGGVICGGCGEMLAMEAPASNRPVLLKPLPAKQAEPPKKKKRKRKLKLEMDSMAGLVKGTAFCIGFTFIGALLWAGVAVLVGWELRIIAVALGGLAGYGMALGHDSDNGLLAGIVAGFIAFCGIIGAKILIVIFLVASLVATGMSNLQREMVVQGMADEIIAQQGGNPSNISLDQRERAVKTARSAVESMDDGQIEAKFQELAAKWENEPADDEPAEVAEAANPAYGESVPKDLSADTQAAIDAAATELAGNELPPGLVLDNAAGVPAEDNAPRSRGLFRIIDLVWIIVAVGTAFKVGSGMGE